MVKKKLSNYLGFKETTSCRSNFKPSCSVFISFPHQQLISFLRSKMLCNNQVIRPTCMSLPECKLSVPAKTNHLLHKYFGTNTNSCSHEAQACMWNQKNQPRKIEVLTKKYIWDSVWGCSVETNQYSRSIHFWVICTLFYWIQPSSRLPGFPPTLHAIINKGKITKLVFQCLLFQDTLHNHCPILQSNHR